MDARRNCSAVPGSIPLGIYSDALESEIIYLIDYSSCRVFFVEDEEQADKIMSLSDSKKLTYSL